MPGPNDTSPLFPSRRTLRSGRSMLRSRRPNLRSGRLKLQFRCAVTQSRRLTTWTRPPRRALTRTLVGVPLAVLVLMAIHGLAETSQITGLTAPTSVQAQAARPRADLLVDFGDGRVVFERIEIESGASGSDLLAASGLAAEMGNGGLVCGLNGVGCPADDCLCACEDRDDCVFWSYFHGDMAVDGGWEFASVGAEGRSLEDGDIDGWVWGSNRQPITATLALRDALAEGLVEDDAGAAPKEESASGGISNDADPQRVSAVTAAAAWMADQQIEDGGFQGFGLGSTIDAVLALASVGQDPDQPNDAGLRPSDALAAGAAEYAAGGASAAGKLLAGAAALGIDPRELGESDVLATLMDVFDPESGAFGAGGTWDQAWPIIGLAAVGEDVPESAVDALIGAAVESGGWGFEAKAETADADSTGLALQALGAADWPESDKAIRSGIAALRSMQNPDGGFAGHDGESNATSTAVAIGGLIAVGHLVDGLGWSVAGVGAEADEPRSPLDALRSFQGPDGAFAGFSGPADPSATYAALLGLSGRALPIEGTVPAATDVEVVDDESEVDAAGVEPEPLASRLGSWALIALIAALVAGLFWTRRRT